MAGLKQIVPWPLAAGLLVLLTMGAVDDARTIKPQIKFVIMILTACFVVIFGEAQITSLGNIFGFGDVTMDFIAQGFTVLCLALLMNSINMMDGVDGLAGGFCSLVTLCLLAVCVNDGQWEAVVALSVLFATLVAFLCFNMRSPFRNKASIFMGDAGALCLGLLLGWFAIKLSQDAFSSLEPVTVIWIIAVPVMDAFALFIARSIRGLHPFNADRRHLHHRFLDAGATPAKTTMMMLALMLGFALVGFGAQFFGMPAYILFYGWMLIFILHTAAIMHPKGYTLLTRFVRGRSRNA